MLTFKCDRCGDNQNLERIHKIVINAHTVSPQHFDLCKKCNQEVIKWLCKNQVFKNLEVNK